MEKREIGNSGIKVNPFAFGGNVFGWTIDEPASFKILDEFVELGLDLIDTADVYSAWKPGNKGGESETIIGNWLKKSGKRDKVVIATKVGKLAIDGETSLSKKMICKAIEASLKRLQTDYVDLYQSHADDEGTPLTETLGAYTDLIKQGKIRAMGASNYAGKRLKEALKISADNNLAAYTCLQPEYNLYERAHYEQDLEPVCLENNIGVINYYALASGFLTGKYRSESDLYKSARGQGVKKFMNDRGFKILKALDEISKEYHSTPAAVSLAWLIARPGITAPIASATSIEQLRDITAAVKLNLSAEAIETLNKASLY